VPERYLYLMWNDVWFKVAVVVLGIAPIILTLLALFWR
jgi:hypothetical protein